MSDAQSSCPVGRARSLGSNRTGLRVVVALGLALASAGFTQSNRDSPSASGQDHMRLPSLAPVVQAVIPAVVRVSAVHRAPGEYPSGKQGDVLTVEFTVLGIPCLGLNGGPAFKHNEAFSFQIATDNQEETDRYWNAIVRNGGQESACGWCKDCWGLSWQITPRALTDALAAGGAEAKRAFQAMMTMKNIDIAKIEAARHG